MDWKIPSLLQWFTAYWFGQEKVIEDIYEPKTDVRYLLSWMAQFATHYEEHPEIYRDKLTSAASGMGAKEEIHVLEAMTKFLDDITILNDALVKGPYDAIFTVTQADDNFMELVDNIGVLKEVFDDISLHIPMWENVTDDVLTNLKITDISPLKWFKDHGFEQSILKDITIQELKKLVSNISVSDGNLYVLLRFAGTSSFYNGPRTIVQKMAWLYSFSTSKELMEALERYLIEQGNGKTDMIAKVIREYLTSMHDHEGPFITFFQGELSQRLYVLDRVLYQNFEFTERHLPRYVKILTRICSALVGNIQAFRNQLKQKNSDEIFDLLVENGFYTGEQVLDNVLIADRAKAFINEDGPITRLCKAVTDCQQILKVESAKNASSADGQPLSSSSEAGSSVHPDSDQDNVSINEGANTSQLYEGVFAGLGDESEELSSHNDKRVPPSGGPVNGNSGVKSNGAPASVKRKESKSAGTDKPSTRNAKGHDRPSGPESSSSGSSDAPKGGAAPKKKTHDHEGNAAEEPLTDDDEKNSKRKRAESKSEGESSSKDAEVENDDSSLRSESGYTASHLPLGIFSIAYVICLM